MRVDDQLHLVPLLARGRLEGQLESPHVGAEEIEGGTAASLRAQTCCAMCCAGQTGAGAGRRRVRAGCRRERNQRSPSAHSAKWQRALRMRFDSPRQSSCRSVEANSASAHSANLGFSAAKDSTSQRAEAGCGLSSHAVVCPTFANAGDVLESSTDTARNHLPQRRLPQEFDDRAPPGLASRGRVVRDAHLRNSAGLHRLARRIAGHAGEADLQCPRAQLHVPRDLGNFDGRDRLVAASLRSGLICSMRPDFLAGPLDAALLLHTIEYEHTGGFCTSAQLEAAAGARCAGQWKSGSIGKAASMAARTRTWPPATNSFPRAAVQPLGLHRQRRPLRSQFLSQRLQRSDRGAGKSPLAKIRTARRFPAPMSPADFAAASCDQPFVVHNIYDPTYSPHGEHNAISFCDGQPPVMLSAPTTRWSTGALRPLCRIGMSRRSRTPMDSAHRTAAARTTPTRTRPIRPRSTSTSTTRARFRAAIPARVWFRSRSPSTSTATAAATTTSRSSSRATSRSATSASMDAPMRSRMEKAAAPLRR